MTTALLLVLLAQQNPALALTGEWQGIYDNNYSIGFEITKDRKIEGKYDNHNELPGTVEGWVKDNGQFKLSLRYGNNHPWADISGTFNLSDDAQTLSDKQAKLVGCEHSDPDNPRPVTIKVILHRQKTKARPARASLLPIFLPQSNHA